MPQPQTENPAPVGGDGAPKAVRSDRQDSFKDSPPQVHRQACRSAVQFPFQALTTCLHHLGDFDPSDAEGNG